jgi:hypothetical protein
MTREIAQAISLGLSSWTDANPVYLLRNASYS